MWPLSPGSMRTDASPLCLCVADFGGLAFELGRRSFVGCSAIADQDNNKLVLSCFIIVIIMLITIIIIIIIGSSSLAAYPWAATPLADCSFLYEPVPLRNIMVKSVCCSKAAAPRILSWLILSNQNHGSCFVRCVFKWISLRWLAVPEYAD